MIIFQHDPFKGPGLISEMFEGRGMPHVLVEAHEDDPFPLSTAGFTGVVSMGGPMSVNDELPFIQREVEFLVDAAVKRIPILGVCLGAQILASALGARVYDGSGPEVGWGEVELTRDGAGDRVLGGFGDRLPVLHWHGETFDLPQEAVLLASSPEYPHQAFRWGDSAYGFQFHLEVTEEMVRDWVREDMAGSGGLISDPEPILRGVKAKLARVSLTGSIVFGRFLDMIKEGPQQAGGLTVQH